MNRDTAALRSRMYRTIREFFDRRAFLEVETPLLTGALIPESTIEIFSTTYEDLHDTPKALFLIPSPEVHMKQLLSRGFGSIYQIGKCFRNCEQRGRNHNPEFSMLEWYETGADYRDSMTRTEELFRTLAPLSSAPLWTRPLRKMSMAEAFWDLERLDLAPLCGEGEEAGLTAGWRDELARRGVESEETGWEPLFNRFFLQFIEPRLPDETPLILYDYPQRIGTLARSVPESPWAQRWELYLRGVEMANCYTEETDPEKIRKYFLEESPLNTTGPLQRVRVPHEVDREYHRHFHSDFPDCSGVALGLDRMLMLLAGKDSLGGVILFPFSDIIAPK